MLPLACGFPPPDIRTPPFPGKFAPLPVWTCSPIAGSGVQTSQPSGKLPVDAPRKSSCRTIFSLAGGGAGTNAAPLAAPTGMTTPTVATRIAQASVVRFRAMVRLTGGRREPTSLCALDRPNMTLARLETGSFCSRGGKGSTRCMSFRTNPSRQRSKANPTPPGDAVGHGQVCWAQPARYRCRPPRHCGSWRTTRSASIVSIRC